MNRSTFRSIGAINQRGLLIGWILLGCFVLLGTQLCSTIWAFSNPSPHHWDNAEYLNQSYKDFWAYEFYGQISWFKGVRSEFNSLMNADPNRPPAYRLASVPFIFFGIRMLALLRAISLVGFWVTLYVIYRTCAITIEGPAGKAAGILAVLLISLYSEVGWSIRVYGSEFTLYFATALTLLCIAHAMRDTGRSHIAWLGLGFATGVGLLSKVSFVLLALPVGCAVFELILAGRLPGLSLWKLAGSVVIALVMAWPYYHLHLLTALHYGQDMTHFQRHSLNRTGFNLLQAWGQLHVNEGMGRPAALIAGTALALAVIAGALRWAFSALRSTGSKWKLGPASLMIIVAIAQGIPLLAFQLLFSKNDNVRHMTPAYLPLTIAVALAAGSAGVLMSWWSWPMLIACALPAFAQMRQEYFPLTTTADDVWDWDPVYQACQRYHFQYPLIGHVGNAGQFCDPAIIYPWAWRGGWANSLWLWRSEDGAFDPVKLHERMSDRDLVLTAPDFHMPDSNSMLADPVELDNAHNAEFARMMLKDPDWELAGKFPIGEINRAEIWMFVRRIPLKH